MMASETFEGALREWNDLFMHRSMGSLFRFARERGLSMPQIGALFLISRKEAGGVMSIGEELGITSPAASQMLDRLAHQGLIEREEDPIDRRAKRISLTESGERTVREGLAARGRWIEGLAARLGPEEIELANAALRILAAKTRELARCDGEAGGWSGGAAGPDGSGGERGGE